MISLQENYEKSKANIFMNFMIVISYTSWYKTYICYFVGKCVNKEIIIKMIGHKRYKTTLDIYVHKNYDDMKRAINQI